MKDTTKARTSETDPIRVNWLIRDDEAHPWSPNPSTTPPAQPGRLGLTLLPGKQCPGTVGLWRRDLDQDLDRLRAMDVTCMVCLVPDEELALCRVHGYPQAARARGMGWIAGPFADGGVPSDVAQTTDFCRDLAARIRDGERLVVHCRGGLGRAGLIGACVMLASGRCRSAEEAITWVRACRPGTVENRLQEAYIEQVAAHMELPLDAHHGHLSRIAGAPLHSDETRQLRGRGAVWGLAVADALGAPVEFLSAEQISRRHGRVSEMMAGGPWRAGEWTDDTALTLATAAAYSPDGFQPKLTCAEMVRWLAGGPKDVGNLTRRAIGYMATPGCDPLAAGRAEMVHNHRAAGNGSLMRALPTALVRQPGPELAAEAQLLSALTHADDRCTAACVAFVTVTSALIHRAVEPLEAIALAANTTRPLNDEVTAICDAVLRGEDARYASRPIGYVLLTLERALLAVARAQSFEVGVLDVISLGGDTDTNAAVAGGLLGARFGHEAIPRRWREQLFNSAAVASSAEALLAVADRTTIGEIP